MDNIESFSIIRRTPTQTPNRDPIKWEIWDLDLHRIKKTCPYLDIDPNKDKRPYLVFSSSDYIAKTNNVTCIPISGFQYIALFEVPIDPDAVNNLDKLSYIHCHAIQTIEKEFLSIRRGLVTNQSIINGVKDKLEQFIFQP